MCDAVGTRRRLGLCRVGKIDPHEESKPWYLDTFLNIYADGILCRLLDMLTVFVSLVFSVVHLLLLFSFSYLLGA